MNQVSSGNYTLRSKRDGEYHIARSIATLQFNGLSLFEEDDELVGDAGDVVMRSSVELCMLNEDEDEGYTVKSGDC